MHNIARPILWAIPTGIVIGVLWIALSRRNQGGYRPTGWLAVLTLGGEAGFALLAFVLFIVGQIVWGRR